MLDENDTLHTTINDIFRNDSKSERDVKIEMDDKKTENEDDFLVHQASKEVRNIKLYSKPAGQFKARFD